MVPYVQRNDPVFLKDSESCLPVKSCTEYLLLEEVLNLPWPALLKFLLLLCFQMVVSG